MLTKIDSYIRLMRLDRPIGTFLLLWPTLWALWIAGDGDPDPTLVIWFILGTFLMRSAGCVMNDYADRDIDGSVERTKTRPLATGELTEKNALIAFALLIGLAFLVVLQFNLFTIILSVFGACIAILYPFAKRYTHFPQVVLGLAFSSGILMSFSATTNTLPLNAWIIFTANFFWNVAYDSQYAMADREDDLKIGVKSTAILFGQYDRLIIGILQLVCLCLLLIFGNLNDLSWHYFLGIFAGACFMTYHQYLIKDRNRELCFKAFLNNNWFGAMIFSGLLLSLPISSQ